MKESKITIEDISQSVFNSDDRVYKLQLKRIKEENLQIGDFITVRCIEDVGELFGRSRLMMLGYSDEELEQNCYILTRADIENIAR